MRARMNFPNGPSPLEGEGRNGARRAAFWVGGAPGTIPPTRSKYPLLAALPLKGGGVKFLLIATIVLLALPLVACGKRGTPDPPAGQANVYPRQYPDPNGE